MIAKVIAIWLLAVILAVVVLAALLVIAPPRSPLLGGVYGIAVGAIAVFFASYASARAQERF